MTESHLGRKASRQAGGVVIDARRRFISGAQPRPLERIVFDPKRQACRTTQMSVDELQSMIELVKREFDALLDERRIAAGK